MAAPQVAVGVALLRGVAVLARGLRGLGHAPLVMLDFHELAEGANRRLDVVHALADPELERLPPRAADDHRPGPLVGPDLELREALGHETHRKAAEIDTPIAIRLDHEVPTAVLRGDEQGNSPLPRLRPELVVDRVRPDDHDALAEPEVYGSGCRALEALLGLLALTGESLAGPLAERCPEPDVLEHALRRDPVKDLPIGVAIPRERVLDVFGCPVRRVHLERGRGELLHVRELLLGPLRPEQGVREHAEGLSDDQHPLGRGNHRQVAGQKPEQRPDVVATVETGRRGALARGDRVPELPEHASVVAVTAVAIQQELRCDEAEGRLDSLVVVVVPRPDPNRVEIPGRDVRLIWVVHPDRNRLDELREELLGRLRHGVRRQECAHDVPVVRRVAHRDPLVILGVEHGRGATGEKSSVHLSTFLPTTM